MLPQFCTSVSNLYCDWLQDLKAEIQMLRTENAKLRDTQPFSHSVSEPDKSASKVPPKERVKYTVLI